MEVLFDYNTNVGIGQPKGDIKLFLKVFKNRAGSGLFGCHRHADVQLNLPNCSLNLRKESSLVTSQ